VNAMMVLDIVLNVSLVSMEFNVNTIVVYVIMNVVIYVSALVVVELGIMNLKPVWNQYVKHVLQIVNVVRMGKHVIFAMMVLVFLSLMTTFIVCHVFNKRNVRTVLFKVVTSVKYTMIR
jgi:hypothetical protein